MRFSYRIVFLVLLALYLISALVGAMISYNQSVAWERFTVIALGIVLGSALMWLPEKIKLLGREVAPLQIFFAGLPLGLLIYFGLTNDWTARLGKLAQFDAVLAALAAWQPQWPGIRLDSNTLGGLLAALLPLQFGAVLQIEKKVGLKILLIGASLAGLVFSESRGAWLALAIVLSGAVLWQASGFIAARRWASQKRQAQIALSITVLVLIAAVGVAWLMPQVQWLLAMRNDRVMVWQNSLALVSDYPFTGIGLGGFDMAYSSYVLLLHVSHTIHAHNLYLDIWLEQGIFGLVILVGLVGVSIAAFRVSLLQERVTAPWQLFAFAALAAILLHGWVDDPFYGYGAKAIPFLFLPFGVLARQERQGENRLARARLAWLGGGVAIIGLLALAIFTPAMRAMFLANLGALSQTQAELSVYQWPRVQIQDDLRRSDKIDLAPAMVWYASALAIDPLNATANRRLGQIELARGHYADAQYYLERALRAAPDQRATRQLLGEVYAIGNEAERAGALWQTIDVSNDQLAIRAWWYEHIGEPENAARMKLAIEQFVHRSHTRLPWTLDFENETQAFIDSTFFANLAEC